MRIRPLVALLLLVVLLAGGACASTGAVPAPFPRPGGSSPAATTYPIQSHAVVSTALSLRGAPYRNGGTGPAGFDCSGFVAYVFAQHRLQVPRTVPEQYRLGRRVDVRRLQPGDLVFFSTVARGASHVGIAVSSAEFVHAPSSAGVVRVEALRSSYWSSRFIGARRLH